MALAPHPHPAVADELLRLGGEARGRAAAAALLAGAAAAGGAGVGKAARERLSRGLARCADDECRRAHAQALGNLRRGDCAEALLELAERGEAGAALAAVDALARAPPAALGFARARRLLAGALNASRPLELRAAALQLGVARAGHLPPVLAELARELQRLPDADSRELRRLLRQRLSATAAAPSAPLAGAARELLAALARDPRLLDWHALATDGRYSSSRLDSCRGCLEKKSVDLAFSVTNFSIKSIYLQTLLVYLRPSKRIRILTDGIFIIM